MFLLRFNFTYVLIAFEKMKQRSIKEYIESPLRDYNITSRGWLGKSSNNSPTSTKIKKRSYKSRSQKITKSPTQKPVAKVTSSSGKCVLHTNYNERERAHTSNERTKPFSNCETCENFDVIVDDILKNIDEVKEEGRIMVDYDDLFKENDISISSSLNVSLDSSKSSRLSSPKIETRLYESRSQKPIKELNSPLGRWLQHSYPSSDTSELKKKPLMESESCVLENSIDTPISRKVSLMSIKNGSTPSMNIKTRSLNLNRCKNKAKKSSSQRTITEAVSPLEKWIQKKKCNELQNKGENETNTSELKKKPFIKRNSFEKYGIILPTVDDILTNIKSMKEEGRMLDDYDGLFEESDISIPSSLKVLLDSPETIHQIPLLTCEHLSQLELETYFSKYSDYLRNIKEGLEYSERHETYKDHHSRSKLTYSFTTVVFTESQLEYLMKNIEKTLDPEEKYTEYLFMVILPELCVKICMKEFNMSKEETIDYLNRRPLY